MKGIQFITDDAGKKTSVVIDLENWGELWEDFSDFAVSEVRRAEKTIPWTKIKKELANRD